MKIAVCLRRVPDTAEADVKVDGTGKGIVEDRLAFTINEADNYALEEALLLKEQRDAEVSLVSVGPKEADEVLRMGLAKGAAGAVRIDDKELQGSDGLALAEVLAAYFRKNPVDLVFTGCIAQDVEDSQVGPALAQLLGWPHTSYVVKLDCGDERMTVRRELEGGFLEVKDIARPAVVSIQTGGNTPRYASILGIKRARTKPLEALEPGAIDLDTSKAGEAGSRTRLERLYVPEVVSAAEMIEGDVSEKAGRLADILKEKGVS
ncbi:MAG: electron transfer flavoprotein subunit beta/FixA family protein [candidate division WOR-3 bacterium]|nr:MAG: electron transfer flavoprotein subunit beta/FixA family protein [candidate division WOR-3 bacterium]